MTQTFDALEKLRALQAEKERLEKAIGAAEFEAVKQEANISPKEGEIYEYERDHFMLIEKVQWSESSLNLYGISMRYNTEDDTWQCDFRITLERTLAIITKDYLKKVKLSDKVSREDFELFLKFAKSKLTEEQYYHAFKSCYY